MNTIRFQIGALATAAAFLTRVPVPGRLFPPNVPPQSLLQAAVAYFPLVGGLIGAATAAVIAVGAEVWPLGLAVLVGLAIEAVLTGAFHEDAVADFCDAFGGGWTRDDVLRILKDSRVGSFGALGLGLAVALRAGATLSVDPAHLYAAVVAAAALGRWAAVWVMWLEPPMSNREGLSRDVARGVTTRQLVAASILAVSGVAAWAIVAPLQIAVVLPLLIVFAVGLARYLRDRIGGTTGDALGFAAYIGQVLVLLVAAARVS